MSLRVKGKAKRAVRDVLAKMIATLVPPGLLQDRRYFRLWEGRGYHITPVHFYSPLPEVRKLDRQLWQTESGLSGIQMDDEKQLRLLASLSRHTKNDVEGFTDYFETRVSELGVSSGSFNSLDGELLYAMVRHLQPRRIVEVGAGLSSYCIGRALSKNREHDPSETCEYISVEPFPKSTILQDVLCLSHLVEQKVQHMPISYFQTLGDGDILFIDSTHVCKVGSDVQYLLLEVIPTLRRGVVVHFHDIFMPTEYPRRFIVDKYAFWNEQYVLQAFLAFNGAFRILLASNYLHREYPEAWQEALVSDTTVHKPGSFWIQRVN